jgi:hypothetical protein
MPFSEQACAFRLKRAHVLALVQALMRYSLPTFANGNHYPTDAMDVRF